jgi:flavin-dependent dehydrogenase
MLLAFPTNDNLTCVAVQVPVAEFNTFRTDIESNFRRTIESAPDLAERVNGGRREERFLGTADLSNFFRKPYGPGWALVGDAGYHKDPITALGISDAFRDAELLADALNEGFSGKQSFEDALAGYERKRNEIAMPMYEEACAMAAFTPFPDEFLRLRAMVRGNQRATDALMFRTGPAPSAPLPA